MANCKTCLHRELCRVLDRTIFGNPNVPCSYEMQEVRGTWKYNKGTYYCSECGGKCGCDDYGDPELTDFCPNCGIKMNVIEE